MVWFKRGGAPQQTGVAMVGAKAGDQVLFVGAGAPDLVAQVALVTGLNGRTTVVAAAGARERVERAAANAGALVDVDDTPAGTGSIAADAFDIVVLTIGGATGGTADLRGAAREAFRVVRAGGRIIVRLPARRSVFSGATADADPLDALLRAGAVAGRLLATAEGVAYYEGRRPRS